jgi:hypothetical protein
VDNAVKSLGMYGDELIEEVNFIGTYNNGRVSGPGWKLLVGGALIYGNFKEDGSLDADDGAFVNQVRDSPMFKNYS